MQIILLEKVGKLGSLGDEVKVRPGFARNYLIPQGKAKRATPDNRKQFEEMRAELEKAQLEKLSQAEQLAAKLNGLQLNLSRRAGVDGRLFGSVGHNDITEALSAKGISISKNLIRLNDGPYKQVGDYQLDISLHSDVIAKITVSIAPER